MTERTKKSHREKAARPPRELQVKGALALGLGAVVPGLGHAYLGRHARALIYFAIIASLMALGLAHEGGLYTPRSGEPLTYLATFGNLGIGPAYFLLKARGFGRGNPDHPTFEYGSTYILTAGLLGFLFMLDAYDIAVGNRS